MFNYFLGFVLKVISFILFMPLAKFRRFNKYLFTTKVYVVDKIVISENCFADGVFYNKATVPYIEVAFNRDILSMVSVLLHELIHAKQFAVGEGDLIKGVDYESFTHYYEFKRFFENAPITLDKDYLEYFTSIWEYEAYTLQGKFNSFYCRK